MCIHSKLLVDQSNPNFGGTIIEADADIFTQIISLEYTWNRLVINGEYYWSERDIQSILLNSDTTQVSYYLGASYKFSELFTLGAYYTEVYPDKDDKSGDKLVARGKADHGAWQKDLAMTLRFDLNDYWVFKIEGHMVDGTAGLIALDNPDSDWSEDKWYYGATKMTFSF